MLRRAAPWLATGATVLAVVVLLGQKLGGVTGLLMGSSRSLAVAGLTMDQTRAGGPATDCGPPFPP